jgi:C4-dicarboxylate-specific signal transduction histidine kinase
MERRHPIRGWPSGSSGTSRTVIEERRHVLAIHAPSERVMVVADTIRLGQVINNVLHNAAR